MVTAAIITLLACGGEEELAAPDVGAAAAAMAQGDISGAMALYREVAAVDPSNLEVAIALSYGALLSGDLESADNILRGAEGAAGGAIGEVLVRRAMVAVERGDMSAVVQLGRASGLAAGKLLAGEALLTESEWGDAGDVFRELAEGQGDYAVVANGYLSLLGDDGELGELAEITASWAMGNQDWVMETIVDVTSRLPNGWSEDDQEILLWAGRAVGVGNADVAEALLGSVQRIPTEQAWRKTATMALVHCARGDAERCTSMLDGLDGAAPGYGLMHARATGSTLLGTSDREAAVAILGDSISNASGNAAYMAGDMTTALRLTPQGLFSDYLRSK
jgi:hypothetical protein